MLKIDEITIEFEDGKKTILNKQMLKNQKVTNEGIETIKKLMQKDYVLRKNLEKTDCPVVLKKLARDWTELQFKLQKAWGFPKNANYFKFFELPKCTCPKLDNYDNLGTGFYSISVDCPLHGK